MGRARRKIASGCKTKTVTHRICMPHSSISRAGSKKKKVRKLGKSTQRAKAFMAAALEDVLLPAQKKRPKPPRRSSRKRK